MDFLKILEAKQAALEEDQRSLKSNERDTTKIVRYAENLAKQQIIFELIQVWKRRQEAAEAPKLPADIAKAVESYMQQLIPDVVQKKEVFIVRKRKRGRK